MIRKYRILAVVIILSLAWAGWQLWENGGREEASPPEITARTDNTAPEETAKAGGSVPEKSGQAGMEAREETASTGVSAREKTMPASPGNASLAPDFTLVDLDGREVRLSELRGKKVLINFWTTWCRYCVEEMPLLQKFYEENGSKEWRVVAVNITSSEKGISSVRDYLKSNSLTFPVLLDRKGSVAALYRVNSIPATFIINEKGEIIKAKVGPFTEKEMAGLAGQ